jgi:hypothetical protein
VDSFRTNDEIVTAYTDWHLMERRLLFVLGTMKLLDCIAHWSQNSLS